MDEKDLRFQRLLREELKSEKKREINFSKTATMIFLIIFIGISAFMLMNFNPSINAYLVREKSANFCGFDGASQKTAYTGPSLGCEYTGYRSGGALINITNNFFQDKGLKINRISINSCVLTTNTTITKGRSKEFLVYCSDIKLMNRISLEYTDLVSGIRHEINGKLSIISR